ncbi:hypothetical protein [Candidatus Halobonum tyrrellensis]|uniref:DUF8048 domain-containing protein n=1 Tax=Candidatus Halobonum tyrrellensis G22 TaxID=1324957 RepID=V4HEZ8_9EURY|nr:hypothetical protein [Candidatus Halobonum tyrrellensis]ESP89285.1 hypothetical protein K933_04686 [Candidatus Halobonum tyrrellensis G22]
MSNDETPDTAEAPIGGRIVERVADERGVDPETLSDALVEVNAVLIGRHGELERSADHVTVDEVRAYRVEEGRWDDLLDGAGFDFGDDLTAAVEAAHTEHARLLFADAVDADERFEPGELGVVVGVDTAEEF